jgi:hypothetical protein
MTTKLRRRLSNNSGTLSRLPIDLYSTKRERRKGTKISFMAAVRMSCFAPQAPSSSQADSDGVCPLVIRLNRRIDSRDLRVSTFATPMTNVTPS